MKRNLLLLLCAASLISCHTHRRSLASFGVTSLTLTNAKTLTDIGPLANGATITLSKTGAFLNVRASTSGNIRCVNFYYDGKLAHSEYVVPYYFKGDTGSWTPTAGYHTFKVVALDKYSNTGGSVWAKFNVISSSSPSPTPTPTPTPKPTPTPSPATSVSITVSITNPKAGDSYRVLYGSSPTLTQTFDLGAGTTGTIKGFSPGKVYYFAMKARNDTHGESAASPTQTYTTTNAAHQQLHFNGH